MEHQIANSKLSGNRVEHGASTDTNISIFILIPQVNFFHSRSHNNIYVKLIK